jgi:hypothetical protein
MVGAIGHYPHMTTEEKLDRLTVLDGLASSVVAHDNQIEGRCCRNGRFEGVDLDAGTAVRGVSAKAAAAVGELPITYIM